MEAARSSATGGSPFTRRRVGFRWRQFRMDATATLVERDGARQGRQRGRRPGYARAVADGSGNRALVIGGGIGGLSTAIALQRAGIDVAVFEQSSELKEIGAGVGLQLACVKALKRMGMLEPILEVGSVPLHALELRHWRTAKVLARVPQLEIGEDVGLYGINIHRGDLLGELAKGAGDVVTLSAQCVG